MSYNQGRSRVVIRPRKTRISVNRSYQGQPREGMVALVLIVAAALATFVALFITSRPYDPMNSTVIPQQIVPPGPLAMQTPPKPSPTISPSPQQQPGQSSESIAEPAGEIAIDDASIQAEIEKTMASDPALSKLDVSTIVENGKVTIAGSVRSSDLKQRVEKVVRSVRGVTGVNNQLVVIEVTPGGADFNL